MRLKNFNYFLVLLISSISFLPLDGEEKIDIWKNKNKTIKELESPKKSDDLNLEKTLEQKNTPRRSLGSCASRRHHLAPALSPALLHALSSQTTPPLGH